MAKRGRKKRADKFKLGDKVKLALEPGRVFELVWYKEGDTTCAIQDYRTRSLAKTSQLIPYIEGEDDIKLATPKTNDKEWMKRARQYLDKIKTEGYE